LSPPDDRNLGKELIVDAADKLESDMDAMSDFLSQAKTFRAQVEGGKVSDEERRRQASAIAMQMSRLMDMGDDSDEEGGGDDSD
jgi:hypothetical protein